MLEKIEMKKILIKKILIKKMLEKNWKNVYARNVENSNEVRRQIILIFLNFGCASQNKALDMMKLVSKILIFIKELMV